MIKRGPRLSILLLGVILAAGGVRAEIATFKLASHIVDPAGVIPVAKARALDAKLARFATETGITILIRFHASSPPESEDAVPGAFMRALSEEFGLIDTGVLAVHFADEDEWRVWIGNRLTAQFVGKAGTAEEHTASGAMHEAKEAWFEEVLVSADKAWKAAAPGSPEAPARLPFAAEAIADGLTSRLAPPAASP